ncbi:acylneuraminate cytidylyltransferase family protein [Halorussus salinisoli]|uniref:acylneuraminate cytidylyltransferase family protein n=1 Tax=Halorussus salinisoli TaxID=2558242 RepID=UPI0010C1A448|nr:acylneuraminate cytidylyltransferase family protein [Halorussus salinisoli]
MIDDKRVVAAVPARGGSTTVPNKNLRLLAGKPLVAWPIDVAAETPEIDRTIVTTDDDEIASTARDWGAEVVTRPDSLAEDDSLVVDALRHLVGELREEGEDAEYLVMLEPTCPLRTSDDVRNCLELLADPAADYDSVATFTEADPSPHRLWDIRDGSPEPFVEGADPWLPRQEQPDGYELTGAVYAFEIDRLPPDGTSLLFGEAGAVTMDRERAVDIDTEFDFQLAELLIEEGIHE